MPASPNPEPPGHPQPDDGASIPAEEAGSPVGDAFAWASRILAIGLGMFLPAVGGHWLDDRLGTRFLGGVGLVFGFTAALVWLVQIGNSVKPYRRRPRGKPNRNPALPKSPGEGTGHD